MTNYTFAKCTVTIFILLAFATVGHAQVAPTQDQIQFVDGLAGRIRTKSQAEVATLQQQLQPAIIAEQQAERVRNDLSGQASRVTGRIETLQWVLREYQRMRGNTDPNLSRQLDFWQREVNQFNQQLRTINAQLTTANTALNDARERRLAGERNVASRQATNIQQLTDLRYLYDMSRLNPPRFSWETMMERIAAVAREKQLTTNVTVTTGPVTVALRYQLVSGGQVSPAINCRQCVLRLPVGHYNFWVDTAGEPQRKAYLIFRESQSIQISQANQNTQ